MAVTITVRLDGRPLRRTYVSHFDFFRIPQTLFFRTNEQGSVTITNAGLANGTFDPAGPSGTITVKVHAQNSVVRVLDGNSIVPLEVARDFTVSNGGVVDINTNGEGREFFRVMDACRDAYDTVFRQFAPFSGSGRQAFPFGQAATVAQTRDRLPRIEVVYPDQSPAVVSFVEPASIGTGFPLVHLKQGSRAIPHEMAHALYFCLMSPATRISVEGQYLAWITTRIAQGLPPFHNTGLATTRFIAWIESLGLFAERFYEFSRRLEPPLEGVGLRREFFRNELSQNPLLEAEGVSGYRQVGTLDPSGKVVPALTGDNVEGAVYGAVFLDFARRVGLREAVGRYLSSADDSVLVFDDFRNLVINETDFDDDIVEVANTWGL